MFERSEKLIIEAAINEQSTKAENPNVPVSAEECAVDALKSAAAGAAIVHFHARDPQTGALLSPGTETYAETHAARSTTSGPTCSSTPRTRWRPRPRSASLISATLAADPAVHLRSATIDPGAANFSWWDPDDQRRSSGDNIFGVSHERPRVLPPAVDRPTGSSTASCARARPRAHLRRDAPHGTMTGTILFKLNLGDNALWGLPPSEAAVDTYLDIVPDDIPYTWMSYTYGP